MTQYTADNEDATKKEDEDPRSGERWEDKHNGRRFTTEIVPDGVQLHYDDGATEGPFSMKEFNKSRQFLDYLGVRDGE